MDSVIHPDATTVKSSINNRLHVYSIFFMFVFFQHEEHRSAMRTAMQVTACITLCQRKCGRLRDERKGWEGRYFKGKMAI
ncbi:MAG: hypothetical protein ABIT72_08160 [Burkholderiaceae bacterium]